MNQLYNKIASFPSVVHCNTSTVTSTESVGGSLEASNLSESCGSAVNVRDTFISNVNSSIVDVDDSTDISAVDQSNVEATLTFIVSDDRKSRSSKSSPVWDYFEHFDLNYHPEKCFHRFCLICHANGIDKAISVGQSYSPGPLITHLWTHNAQYLEFIEKKNSASVSSTMSSQQCISCLCLLHLVSRIDLKGSMHSGLWSNVYHLMLVSLLCLII